MTAPTTLPPAMYPPPGTLPPPPPSTPATLSVVFAILRARLRAAWNTLRRGGSRRVVVRLLVAALVIAFVVVPATALLVALVRYDARINPAEAARYPPAILLIVALLLLFSNFAATLHALYFSPTLPLLLAAPVPLRAVFLVALAEGAVAAPFVLLLGAFVLVACGIGTGAGATYYLVAAVALLLVAAFVAALTQLVVTATARVVPARRTRELLTLVGAVLSVVAYGAYYLSRFGSRPSRGGDLAALRSVVDRLDPASRLVPPGWAGRAVAAALAGDALAAVGWLAAAALATVLVIELAARVFRRAYLVGWSAVRGVAPGRAETPGRGATLDRLLAPVSPPVRAVAAKEIRTLVRDTRRLSTVVRSAGFALVYLVLFVFGGGSNGFTPGRSFGMGGAGGADVLFWSRAVFVAFVVGGLASGVSAYTFGAEGAQFVLYRLAPVSARSLLFAKWLAGAVLVAPVAVALAVGVGVFLRGGVVNIALLALFTLWYALGSVANAVATAAIGARFDGVRPDRATTWGGGVARLAFSALFFVGSLLLWGAVVFPVSARLPFIPAGFAEYAPPRLAIALVGAAVAGGGLAFALSLGAARVRRLLRPVE